MRKCIRQQLPLPQHNYSISSPPGQTLTAGLISILLFTPQRPFSFHSSFFFFLFCCFLLFLIKISSNVWSSTWKRDYLYILYQVCDRLCFFFVFLFCFFVPEMGEIILKARGERGLFFLKISDFSKECFYNLTHNSTLIHLTDSRAFNFFGGVYFFLTSGRDERSIRELKCESLSAPWQRSVV